MISKTKEGKVNWGFNFSYSTYSSFKKSQLMFYFQKIKQEVPSDQVVVCYGDAGNVLHSCCEEYIKDKTKDVFRLMEKLWFEKELDKKLSFKGQPLEIDDYKFTLTRAIKIIDENYPKNPKNTEVEKHIEFQTKEFADMVIKGYIDLVYTDENGDVILVDWKSNTTSYYELHKEQRLCYSWLYWKEFGIVPKKCVWYYLKTNKPEEDSFTLDEVLEFEKEVKKFIKDVYKKGNNINNYELGDFNFVFNSYKTLCQIESVKRRDRNRIVLTIQDNKLHFDNLPASLSKTMSNKYSYYVNNYFRTEKYNKGLWDGKKRFFDPKENVLPYGFLSNFKSLLEDYNQHFKTNYSLCVFDKRNLKVVGKIYNTKFLEPPIELRYYQKEAVDIAMKKGMGILNLATSAGKSYIAAEIIKRHNKRTLCIVNKIELARQFQDDLESYLGVEVGLMTEGELDVSKQITVASIQTIIAIMKRGGEEARKLSLYLFNVACVVYDEAQNLKNAGMYKQLADYLRNVVNVYGMTGTAYRNYKPETMEMYSLLGTPIYVKSIQELEKEGFVVPVDAYFLPGAEGDEYEDYDEDYDDEDYDKIDSYHEVYRESVVENFNRNESVCMSVTMFRKSEKKILVVTRSIEHAKTLGEMIPNSFVITGSTNSKKRKEMFEKFKSSNDYVLVGSLKIFSAGINIPTLDVVVCASGHASIIDTPQLAGRLRRLSDRKKKGYFIDFIDKTKFLYNHYEMRREYLELFGCDIFLVDTIEDMERRIDERDEVGVDKKPSPVFLETPASSPSDTK